MKTLCNAVRQKNDQGQRAPQNYTDSTVVDIIIIIIIITIYICARIW